MSITSDYSNILWLLLPTQGKPTRLPCILSCTTRTHIISRRRNPNHSLDLHLQSPSYVSHKMSPINTYLSHSIKGKSAENLVSFFKMLEQILEQKGKHSFILRKFNKFGVVLTNRSETCFAHFTSLKKFFCFESWASVPKILFRGPGGALEPTALRGILQHS